MSEPLNGGIMYLTIDDSATELTKLWVREPAYFAEECAWSRPGGALTSSSSMFWPGLKEKALALGLKPGAEGIAEVTLDIRRVAGQ
ncbi:hypothetical protein LCGC14_2313310 [marine sediment metagenome]|uniref:Uncharacterized protein n=1 Tax=marine sediment metagenome TaxID=412755 RepID=A0A0F9FEV3_9ZZZZ